MTALSREALCRQSIPVNDQARLAELRRFEILDTLPEEAFDRLTALTALTFNTPIAPVAFVDRSRHWFKL
jgi:hypothetical protein